MKIKNFSTKNSLTISLLLICSILIKCQKENDNVGTQKQTISAQIKQVQKVSYREIAENMKPKGSVIVHEVIEIDLWNVKDVIIVFYESRYVEADQYKNERQFVECYLLVPNRTNKYEKILVNKFQDDNVDTEIASIFFANADQDKEKELIIISTCKHRLQYLYEGTEFTTDVFDNINLRQKFTKESLTNLYEMSDKLSGGFQGFTEDDPKSIAKFTNAEEVRAELQRLKL